MKTEKGCRVKMSHELQSCIDELKQYEKICVSFVDVANMVTSDAESFKLILNQIENVWKDLSKTIQCDGNQTNVVTGQGSCSNNVRVTKNATK